MEKTLPSEALTAPEYTAIKLKQQATWASGDYAQVGVTIVLIAELLCDAMDLHSGWKVLDVAAGSGNASLAAARCGCRVTSTDYVPALLENGRQRAAADGLRIVFEEADAENLPFPDFAFDAALSTVGIMFTPNQEKSASEIARVVKPGGTIGLACWTPAGFVGQIFRVLGKYIPPAPGLRPPSLWGTEARLHELFPNAASIHTTTRNFHFRSLSPEAWLDNFKTYYGPMLKAFASLDQAAQAGLRTDLLALVASLNRATDGTMILPSEYLEIVITT